MLCKSFTCCSERQKENLSFILSAPPEILAHAVVETRYPGQIIKIQARFIFAQHQSRFRLKIYFYIMPINQRLNFGFKGLHENQIQESAFAVLINSLQSFYFSNGNMYIRGISHRLSITSQAQLLTNKKKLKKLRTFL